MPNDKADSARLMREAIATRVRGALAESRKTQQEVGEALGIPQPAVHLRLVGKRPFRAEELAALAEFLGVPIERFMPVPDGASAA